MFHMGFVNFAQLNGMYNYTVETLQNHGLYELIHKR